MGLAEVFRQLGKLLLLNLALVQTLVVCPGAYQFSSPAPCHDSFHFDTPTRRLILNPIHMCLIKTIALNSL